MEPMRPVAPKTREQRAVAVAKSVLPFVFAILTARSLYLLWREGSFLDAELVAIAVGALLMVAGLRLHEWRGLRPGQPLALAREAQSTHRATAVWTDANISVNPETVLIVDGSKIVEIPVATAAVEVDLKKTHDFHQQYAKDLARNELFEHVLRIRHDGGTTQIETSNMTPLEFDQLAENLHAAIQHARSLD